MIFLEPDSVHPALLPEQQLATQCRVERTRRSGPGGQHRNKVETAVVMTHLPTGVLAEASERRSQADNLQVATFRLRINLALNVRRSLTTFRLADAVPARADGPTHADPVTQPDPVTHSGTVTPKSAAADAVTPGTWQVVGTYLPSDLWCSRCRQGRISVNSEHRDFPAVLAEALDVVAACDSDLRPAAQLLGCTTSQLGKLLQQEPRAWQWVNQQRDLQGKHRWK